MIRQDLIRLLLDILYKDKPNPITCLYQTIYMTFFDEIEKIMNKLKSLNLI